MRITTVDLDEHKVCGIELPLRCLSASSDPLEAAYWHMLLNLVAHLQSRGSEHELWGQIILRELLLYKREPPDPVRQRETKEFMDEWRELNPDPATCGDRLSREMRRRFVPQAMEKHSLTRWLTEIVPNDDFSSLTVKAPRHTSGFILAGIK